MQGLPRSTSLLLLLAAAAVGIAAGGCGDDEPPADAPRPVALALDFMPNAAHAGVYAARRDGLDRRQGIDLKIRAPSASTDSLKLLASGRADVAIVDIHDLGLARRRGADIVGVGAIVQQPLAAVIARPGVKRPRDLEGKRVGVTGLPSDDAVLKAVVEADGGDPGRVQTKTIGFSAVPSLVAGKVDAVVSFWNAEGVALRERGVRTREFRLGDYGAPSYPELVLATRRETLERNRGLVDATVAAVKAGTEAAIEGDRGPLVREIARAGGADTDLVRAQLAAVLPAFSPPLALRRKQLEGWARFDTRFGILERRPDIERAFSLPTP